MSNIATFLSNEILDHVLDNSAYTSPTTVYLALFTAEPGDDDTGTEITGLSGYARQAMSFATAASRSSATDADIEFGPAGESFGTITSIGIYDASTSGNLLFWGALSASKAIDTNDSLKVSSGDLTVTFTATP